MNGTPWLVATAPTAAVSSDRHVGLVVERHRLDEIGRGAQARRVTEGIGALELGCGDGSRGAGHGEHVRVGGDPRLAGVRRPSRGDGDVTDALGARHAGEDDAAYPRLL